VFVFVCASVRVCSERQKKRKDKNKGLCFVRYLCLTFGRSILSNEADKLVDVVTGSQPELSQNWEFFPRQGAEGNFLLTAVCRGAPEDSVLAM
jgi:hypothetical protein